MKTCYTTPTFQPFTRRPGWSTGPGLAVLFLVAAFSPEAAFTQVTNNTSVTSFYPTNGPGSFGSALAALGNDRVIIGAPAASTGATGAGLAFLFNTNGTQLAIFTNPAPATSDAFGYAVAAVGSDRVLISAYLDDAGAANAGSAYLFNTNGTLLTTLTNPTPASGEQFGVSVAAVGSSRALIAAHLDGTGATGAGSVYLFSTNGTLVTTITNPTPALNDGFGISVAVLGNDRLLVGAYQDDTSAFNAGTAYLFNTNGILLSTILNPFPAASDQFGRFVTTLGSDRLLVYAPVDDAGISGSGVVYLMNTNGALLTTITNPAPAVGDAFGSKMAAVESDRVLIGASGDDTFGSEHGTAYLFSTNGTLLVTFTEFWQGFGGAVAVVGDRALVSSIVADVVYLFDTSYTLNTNTHPVLNIARSGSTVSVSWVTSETGLILQQTDILDDFAVWDDTPGSVSVNGLTNTVLQSLENTNRFYRLRQP